MDLQKLRIDRGQEDRPATSSGPAPKRVSLAPLVWLALVAGVAYLFRAPLTARIDELRLPRVQVAVAYEPDPIGGSAIRGVAANGYIVARNRAALSADTPGRVVELNVEEGSVVRAGDVVARLFADEFEAAVRAAEAEVEVARAAVVSAEASLDARRRSVEARTSDLEAARARVRGGEASLELSELQQARAEELEANRYGSKADADSARAARKSAAADLDALRSAESSADAALREARGQLAQAEAAASQARAQVPLREALLAQARATLDKTIVRAPFDGVVVLKDAEVGEVVSPNSQGASSRGSVATLVDFSSLEVQVELPETSLSAARVGDAATAWLDAFPETAHPVTVQRIWPTANRQKATVEVRLGFDSPDERLRPEMGVRVVFGAAEESATAEEAPPAGVLVPESALVRVDGAEGAFALERDVARWRPLEVGARRGGRALVTAGLEAGERVVVDPPPTLTDGDRVRPKTP
jgi:RND family efflux transporter MFP subunit